MKTADFSRLGFCAFVQVAGRRSIAHLIPQNGRCGIYILKFSDGALYAGQSIDIIKRFSQHRKAHPDIQELCWKAVGIKSLDDSERIVISNIEDSGNKIRNIQFTSLPLPNSELEILLTGGQLSRFLENADWNDEAGDRHFSESEIARMQRRFMKLKGFFGSDALFVILGHYLTRCVPAPFKTEMSHWAASCLPASSSGEVICRVNVGWQEVLTVGGDAEAATVYFQVRRSVIGRSFRDLLAFRRRHPSIVFFRSSYSAGGADQIRIASPYLEGTLRLLQDSVFVLAARHLNVALATRSGCMWARSHCPQLVTAALAAVSVDNPHRPVSR